MNDLKIFENEQFGSIRTAIIDGKPMFCANDVAKALGYSRPADAVTAHCKGSVKHRVLTDGGSQDVKYIPEGDVYRLIVKSKLPAAEKFEAWVMDEVLPTIRKYGLYTREELLADPDLAIEAWTALKKERAEKALLEQENNRLSAANDLMSIENRTWEERTIVTTLVPSIACKFGLTIPAAYNELYREAKKKYHFDLPQRQRNWNNSHPHDKKHPALDFASEEEIHKLTVICATNAYRANVSMVKLLNEVNAKHAMEIIEEYEENA